MKCYSLSHLADHVLRRELSTLVTQDWAATARLLACLAEFDERKLYLPAGYPSMFAYCVRELRMSEDVAFKRIRTARAAREFPAIFRALAEGRLHVSGVVLLAPYLSPNNADELLAMATHKSKAEIELLLAQRFPQPDVPTLVHAVPEPAARAVPEPAAHAVAYPAVQAAAQPAARAVPEPTARAMADPAVHAAGSMPSPSLELAIQQGVACAARAACEGFHEVAPGPVVPSSGPGMPATMGPLPGSASCRAKLAPLAPGRFALQMTVNQATHDLLRHAQALLGHAVPSGDVAEVIERALTVLVEQLEKQKFAKASRPRPRRGAANGRYVPAEIRRAVWQRDGGQCTFVSDSGHRCEARARLEFDHIEPVARGGRTTAANTRLRCRAHNQFAAERAYGAGFMREKREAARHQAAERRARAEAEAQARPCSVARQGPSASSDEDRDVVPWLRQLGYGVEQARRGAALCAHIPDASLEERVKLALRGLAPASVRRTALAASAPA